MLTLAVKEGSKVIAGVDEAGRGPIAGPVVAAAVILHPNKTFPDGINDSKALSEAKREKLYDAILEVADVGVGIVSEEVIDEINILQATFKAMRESVNNLTAKPDYLFIDGNLKCPDMPCLSEPVIKGDATYQQIAAASIVAKVTRDAIMKRLHATYPVYCWADNKGYGSKVHIEALREYGATKYHRKSFEPVKSLLNQFQLGLK